MTTIVVVKKAGQAVIAGDTLTTFGSTRLGSAHDAAPEKILRHNGTFFGIAGSAAHQMVLESILTNHEKAKNFLHRFRTRHGRNTFISSKNINDVVVVVVVDIDGEC